MASGGNRELDRGANNELLITGWITVGSYLLMKFSNELRKVFCCLGLVRSPLYNWIKGRFHEIALFYQKYFDTFQFIDEIYYHLYFPY